MSAIQARKILTVSNGEVMAGGVIIADWTVEPALTRITDKD